MKFKIDENLPSEVAQLLNSAGHDAATVIQQGMAGWKDKSISIVCADEERAILTNDLDFADVRVYPPQNYFGIIILRLSQQDKVSLLRVVSDLIPLLETEKLVGELWIVDDHRIRIRRANE